LSWRLTKDIEENHEQIKNQYLISWLRVELGTSQIVSKPVTHSTLTLGGEEF
jgi:hypothetical protein